MVARKTDGPANVMWSVRRLVIVSLLLYAYSGIADGQVDTANAKAVDGFSAAIVTAGDHLICLKAAV